MLTTGDRLSCLSLFLDAAVPWSAEVWESRFKALVAIIQSGTETVGMEGDLLRVLRSWIEGAFEGLARHELPSVGERTERQRSIKSLTDFLTTLVGKPEFVSRLSEGDTAGVLQLWEELIDQALLIPVDYASLGSPACSPNDLHSPKTTSPQRLSQVHRRHHSSTSLPSMASLKHPADIVVDAYLTYLSTRLEALAPEHLENISPLLFRALAFYATPLPRVSLESHSSHEHPIEKKITERLVFLVSGPYSSSCTRLLKRHLLPSSELGQASAQASVGAVRTLRVSIREAIFSRLARAHITRVSSTEHTPAGVPTRIDLERSLMERAWPKDASATASWDLSRFRGVLCRGIKAWIEKDLAGQSEPVGALKEAVLNEVAGILKDVVQAIDLSERETRAGEGRDAGVKDGEEMDDEEISSFGDILQELVAYIKSIKYVLIIIIVLYLTGTLVYEGLGTAGQLYCRCHRQTTLLLSSVWLRPCSI